MKALSAYCYMTASIEKNIDLVLDLVHNHKTIFLTVRGPFHYYLDYAHSSCTRYLIRFLKALYSPATPLSGFVW